MTHDDFATEPVHGLAKELPKGETLLWQGRPQVWALAVASMNVHWVIGYFALLAVWRGLAAGPGAAVFYVVAGGIAVGLIMAAALIFARTTVYTITSARVVLRIGAALTVSLNLPLKWIASADLALGKDGTGSIHLALKGQSKVSYLVLWPHVRPWKMGAPQPTLRAIPDAAKVAAILAEAAAEQLGALATTRAVVPTPTQVPAGAAIPAE